MAGARFTPVPGLDEIVARMIAPGNRGIAVQVEREAKAFAPPTKTWRATTDSRVRRQHVHANGMEEPENLRFELPAYQWDVDHPGAVGALRSGTPGGPPQHREAKVAQGLSSYLLYPRDQSSRTFVALINCRCNTVINPDGIRKNIRTNPTTIVKTKVTTEVVATGHHIVEAERGDTYPGGIPVAVGSFFMKRAVGAVAVRLRAL